MKNLFPFILFASLILFASFSASDLSDDVLQYTNRFRKSNQLEDLRSNRILNEIALQHSKDMASGKVKFGHTGFKSRNENAVKQIPGLGYFAENVAYGPYTGEEVVDLWKRSQGHRENMLGKYKIIGIGVAKSKDGTYYYTQIFAN